jgi:hypothetical protein
VGQVENLAKWTTGGRISVSISEGRMNEVNETYWVSYEVNWGAVMTLVGAVALAGLLVWRVWQRGCETETP